MSARDHLFVGCGLLFIGLFLSFFYVACLLETLAQGKLTSENLLLFVGAPCGLSLLLTLSVISIVSAILKWKDDV